MRQRPPRADGRNLLGTDKHQFVRIIIVHQMLEFPLVVDVSGLAVNDLTKQPHPCHVERKKLRLAVAAVFEHHAVAARLLARLHLLPELFDSERTGHLGEHMLAVEHGAHVDRMVRFPVGDGIHNIHVRIGAQAFIPLDPCVFLRFRESVLHSPVVCLCNAARNPIADGGHAHTRQDRKPSHTARSTGPYADEPDPNLVHGLVMVALHRRAGRTIRQF